MKNIIKEEINPTFVPNATMVKLIVDGVYMGYQITPNAGFVLHDKARDWYDTDPTTGLDYSSPTRGYTTGMASCSNDYNFDKKTIINGTLAYGSREFFTLPEEDVEAVQVFSVLPSAKKDIDG